MWRACGDLVNRWNSWRRTRGVRLAKAVWDGAALVAMTAFLIFLYACSRVARAVGAVGALLPKTFGKSWSRTAVLVIGGVALAVPVSALVLESLWPARNVHPPQAVIARPEAPRPSVPMAVAPRPETEAPPVIVSKTMVPESAARSSVAEAEPPPQHREPQQHESAVARQGKTLPPPAHEEEAAAEADQGFSVFATLAEAVMHQIGESLGFFEIGHKINEVFIPLKDGDTTTAVSKGAGAATEYSIAVYLVDAFEIMGLIASGVMIEAVAGVAGSMAIVRTSVMAGDQVEETTHRSLSPREAP